MRHAHTVTAVVLSWARQIEAPPKRAFMRSTTGSPVSLGAWLDGGVLFSTLRTDDPPLSFAEPAFHHLSSRSALLNHITN